MVMAVAATAAAAATAGTVVASTTCLLGPRQSLAGLKQRLSQAAARDDAIVACPEHLPTVPHRCSVKNAHTPCVFLARICGNAGTQRFLNPNV